MIRLILFLFIGAALKGIILFIFMLSGDFFGFDSPVLELFIAFAVMGALDWKLLGLVKGNLGHIRWHKSLAFSYLSFVGILWVTGPLFSFYNSLMSIETDTEPNMPSSALIIVLITGFITSSISSFSWTRKRLKTTANNG